MSALSQEEERNGFEVIFCIQLKKVKGGQKPLKNKMKEKLKVRNC